MTTVESIAVRRSILSTSFALIPGVLFFGLGLWIAIFPFPEGPGVRDGMVCTAIGIVLLALCGREMADRDPYIVMDAQGLRTMSLSMALIPWSEMRSVKLISSVNGDYLLIEVDDPRKYDAVRRGYTRADRWMDKVLGDEGIGVGAAGLELKSTAILALVRARINENN